MTTASMTIDRIVLLFAGSVILASLVLSQVHHEYWLWLTAFAGANLVQSAFTGFCVPAIVLRKMGMRPSRVF